MRSAPRMVASRWAMTRPVRPLQELHQRLLDLQLGIGIDAGGGFVEHEDLGVGDQRAGKADQLALAERKIAAALFELGVVALGQPHDELVRADCLAPR